MPAICSPAVAIWFVVLKKAARHGQTKNIIQNYSEYSDTQSKMLGINGINTESEKRLNRTNILSYSVYFYSGVRSIERTLKNLKF